MSDRLTHTPRCGCGAVQLGPGIAHCGKCHKTFSSVEEYNAHLLAVPRAGDIPDFRCRSVSSVVAVSEETLDTYRQAFHGDTVKVSDLDTAELCGRLAYRCGELLKLVENKTAGIEKAMGVAYRAGTPGRARRGRPVTGDVARLRKLIRLLREVTDRLATEIECIEQQERERPVLRVVR